MRRFTSTFLVLLSACVLPAVSGCTSDTASATQDHREHLGSFEFFTGEDGQHYFRLVTQRGTKLLRSEGYTERASAEKGARSVITHGEDTANYDVLLAEDGRFYFNLVASNNEIIATSSSLFERRQDAEASVEEVRTIIGNLERDDEAASATCTLTRLENTPQGAAESSASVDITATEDQYIYADGLDAWDRNYSFNIYYYPNEDTDFFEVLFEENNIAVDEVGSLWCEIAPSRESGAIFCDDIIEVPVGEWPDEEYVHAFDFKCTID